MRHFLFIALIAISCVSSASVSLQHSSTGITMIEYFDYNCPVCRGFQSTVKLLQANNPDLIVEQRVIPVLAPSSTIIDSVILASRYQSKFTALHNAVFKLQVQETIPFPLLVATLHSLHIDIARINSDMKNPAIRKVLLTNLQAYSRLGVHRIPVIVIFKTNNPHFKLQFVGSQPLSKLEAAIRFLKLHGAKNVN